MWDLQVLKPHGHEHGEDEATGILENGERGVHWTPSPTWQLGRSRPREVKQQERLQNSSSGLSREGLP